MRRVEPGINWVWYYTGTREEGEKWYEELTGVKPSEGDVISWKGEWAFRLHK